MILIFQKQQLIKKINVMKKSIVYLGVALVAFANVSFASNSNSLIANKSIEAAYQDVSALNIAISKGDVQTVKKLVEYGADVNEKSNGITPLMIAARYNKVEIIKFLLANGAKLNIKDVNGFTALKYAELSNANEAVQFLRQA